MITRFILPVGHGMIFLIHLMHRSLTPFAHKKRLSLFYPDQWNKKEIKIVVYPFKIGLRQTACQASSGMTIKDFCFRRNTGN